LFITDATVIFKPKEQQVAKTGFMP